MDRHANSVDQPVLPASTLTNVKLAPADSILDLLSVSNVVIKKLLKVTHAPLAVKDVTNAQVLTHAQLVNQMPLSLQITNVFATMDSSGTLIPAYASRVVTPAQHVRMLTSVRLAQPGLNSGTRSACSARVMNTFKGIYAQLVALIVSSVTRDRTNAKFALTVPLLTNKAVLVPVTNLDSSLTAMACVNRVTNLATPVLMPYLVPRANRDSK